MAAKKRQSALPFGDNSLQGMSVFPARPATRCTICKELLPTDAEHFLFENGDPTGPCLTCIEKMPMRTKLNEARNATNQLMFTLAQEGFSAPQCVDMYVDLVKKLGGIDAITSMWSSTILIAFNDPKSSKKMLLDQFRRIFEMGRAVQDQAMKASDQLTDDELASEIEKFMQAKQGGIRTRATTGKLLKADRVNGNDLPEDAY